MTTIRQDFRQLTTRQRGIVLAVVVGFIVFLAALMYTFAVAADAADDFSSQVSHHLMSPTKE
jgi:predicted metal-binding membrane protein